MLELTDVLYLQVRVPLNTARELPDVPRTAVLNLFLSACRSEHGRVQRSVQNA